MRIHRIPHTIFRCFSRGMYWYCCPITVYWRYCHITVHSCCFPMTVYYCCSHMTACVCYSMAVWYWCCCHLTCTYHWCCCPMTLPTGCCCPKSHDYADAIIGVVDWVMMLLFSCLCLGGGVLELHVVPINWPYFPVFCINRMTPHVRELFQIQCRCHRTRAVRRRKWRFLFQWLCGICFIATLRHSVETE